MFIQRKNFASYVLHVLAGAVPVVFRNVFGLLTGGEEGGNVRQKELRGVPECEMLVATRMRRNCSALTVVR